MIKIKRRYEDQSYHSRFTLPATTRIDDSGRRTVVQPRNIPLEVKLRSQELRQVLYTALVGGLPKRVNIQVKDTYVEPEVERAPQQVFEDLPADTPRNIREVINIIRHSPSKRQSPRRRVAVEKCPLTLTVTDYAPSTPFVDRDKLYADWTKVKEAFKAGATTPVAARIKALVSDGKAYGEFISAAKYALADSTGAALNEVRVALSL
jgi:hypothetical protein